LLATEKRENACLEESVVLTLPDMDQVTIANVAFTDELSMDVYYPPGFDFQSSLPVIVLVSGAPDSSYEQRYGCKHKDLSHPISWAQLIAASGLIFIMYESRLPTRDIHDVLNFIIRNHQWLRISSDRICILSGSVSTPIALHALTETIEEYSNSIVCGVIYYGDCTLGARQLRSDIPLFVVKAGLDNTKLNERIDRFVNQAMEAGVDVEFVIYEEGKSAFDVYMDTNRSREIIIQTIEWTKGHLGID
jgi:hypothetical protein